MKGKNTEFAKFKSIMSKVKKNKPEVTATGKVQWGKSKQEIHMKFNLFDLLVFEFDQKAIAAISVALALINLWSQKGESEMGIICILLGIALEVVKANGWFTVPVVAEYVVFGLGALLTLINIISWFSMRNISKRF